MDEVGSQVLSTGSYWPPLFMEVLPSLPPQITILLPVHTAECPERFEGAPPTLIVAIQESVRGSYRPPLLRRPRLFSPPQITILLPVQTAVWCERPDGASKVEIADHVSVTGS